MSLASSFNCIQAYQKEIKLIDQAIEKCINGLNPNAFIILKSITGIGPVWASGILAEIGDITGFHSSDALAKYAGLSDYIVLLAGIYILVMIIGHRNAFLTPLSSALLLLLRFLQKI